MSSYLFNFWHEVTCYFPLTVATERTGKEKADLTRKMGAPGNYLVRTRNKT